MRTTLPKLTGLSGLATAAGAAAMMACGGSLSSSGTAGADGGAESAAGHDAGTTSDATFTFDVTTQDVGAKDVMLDALTLDGGVCPPSPPATGSSCTAQGTLCEYGTAWLAECDVVAVCQKGVGGLTWTLEYDGGSGCFVTAGGSTCPPTLAAARDTPCPQSGTGCQYPEGWCECEISCGGPPPPLDAGSIWLCSTPPVAGCSPVRPRFGSSCANEPAGGCDYGLCCGGSNMQCQGGTWQGTILIGGCP